MGSHSAVVKRERAMGILVFLLLFLLFEDNVSCQRLRCGPSQKMNAYGRCVKAWSSTISMAQSEINVVETLASELRSRLGNNILIPCKDVDNCEACFNEDPGKIFCPKKESIKKSRSTPEYVNGSVYSDLSDWQCSELSPRVGPVLEAFSYWSGYDDGSICDCGTPFAMQRGDLLTHSNGSDGFIWSFRPLNRNSSRKWGLSNPWTVYESTGGPGWFVMENDGLPVNDNRPPYIPAQPCNQYPDISSIFKLNILAGYNLQPVNMAGQSCFVDDCWSNEGCDPDCISEELPIEECDPEDPDCKR